MRFVIFSTHKVRRFPWVLSFQRLRVHWEGSPIDGYWYRSSRTWLTVGDAGLRIAHCIQVFLRVSIENLTNSSVPNHFDLDMLTEAHAEETFDEYAGSMGKITWNRAGGSAGTNAILTW